MYINWPKIFTDFLGVFAKILHKKWKLSPNQVSILAFIASLIAAGLIYGDHLTAALILLLLSLFLDALDGTIARKYNLKSSLGQKLELIFDRTAELVLFLSLAAVGFVSFWLVGITWGVIIIMTFISQRTRIDIGFKRIMIFFGPIIGFSTALHIVIAAQLVSIILGIIKESAKYVRSK